MVYLPFPGLQKMTGWYVLGCDLGHSKQCDTSKVVKLFRHFATFLSDVLFKHILAKEKVLVLWEATHLKRAFFIFFSFNACFPCFAKESL